MKETKEKAVEEYGKDASEHQQEETNINKIFEKKKLTIHSSSTIGVGTCLPISSAACHGSANKRSITVAIVCNRISTGQDRFVTVS